MRRLPAVLLAPLLLAGCGAKSADLFAVERTGTGAGAALTMVVSDSGQVTCNDREPKALPAEQLLAAREIARSLETPAALGLELPPADKKGSTFQYKVHVEDGTVAFADNSRGKPEAFLDVAAFTRVVGKTVCGLKR